MRIYRCEKDKPRSFVGVVEEVGLTGKKAFKNMEELWDILTARDKESPHIDKESSQMNKDMKKS